MVRNVGKSLGLEFSTTRERFASTLKGHALLEFAKESAEEKQDSVAEKLFKVPSTQLFGIQSIKNLSVGTHV